jgi:hypothetical protein
VADQVSRVNRLESNRGWEKILVGFVAVAAAFPVGGWLRERLEEAPHIPFELAEYAGVKVGDLGTEGLFDDPAALEITIRARRHGRVRFLVAGDGGQDEDPAKRAVSRAMRQLCERKGCDFALFLGDNVYPDGIDTFSTAELTDSIPGFDLQKPFLESLPPGEAAALAGRVRAAAGRVARACGRDRSPSSAGDLGPEDGLAGVAFYRHFQPKFERSFAWLAQDRIPAFALLGNHDLRSPFGSECEIGYSLAPGTAWRMPYYFYQVTVADSGVGEPIASLFVLDSAPPHGDPRGENYARIGPRQGRWLRAALAASRARWQIAAAHAPVWSAGRHVFTEYLSFHRDLWSAAREAGSHLDLLIGGHNHWLESARVTLDGRPTLQIVSGALSKVSLAPMLARGYPLVRGLVWDRDWRQRLRSELATDPRTFLAADRSVLARGFALVEIAGDTAKVQFYGVGGMFYEETFLRAASASRSAFPMGREDSASPPAQANGSGTRDGGEAVGTQTSGVSTSRKWE